jgi:CRP/FNR family transcriptional regulator, cyclic AMP receptor protein
MSAKQDIMAHAIWAGELTEEERERAGRGLVERSFPKGAYICHRGDTLAYWTGVITGLVKISAISRDGKAMTFAGAADGSWFGEGSVLKDEPRKYDLVAVRETRLAMMPRATFMWLFENSTGFNRFLVRQFNERMGQFIATIEYDRILTPKERVARNLSWFFNPVLYPKVRTWVEISQEELALLVGLSRQVVNRSLRSLEEEGLIRLEHGRIVALDMEALTTYEA